MKQGETLMIVATDPGAVKDFEAFAKQTNNLLLSSTETDGKFNFVIEKT
jgi:tRNA 2-thiouridine synthesizing protein A